MGNKDECESTSASPITFLMPILVLAVAIVVTFASLGSESNRAAIDGLRDLAANNQILQAFIASSIMGVVSYVILLTGRHLMVAWAHLLLDHHQQQGRVV